MSIIHLTREIPWGSAYSYVIFIRIYCYGWIEDLTHLYQILFNTSEEFLGKQMKRFCSHLTMSLTGEANFSPVCNEYESSR